MGMYSCPCFSSRGAEECATESQRTQRESNKHLSLCSLWHLHSIGANEDTGMSTCPWHPKRRQTGMSAPPSVHGHGTQSEGRQECLPHHRYMPMARKET